DVAHEGVVIPGAHEEGTLGVKDHPGNVGGHGIDEQVAEEVALRVVAMHAIARVTDIEPAVRVEDHAPAVGEAAPTARDEHGSLLPRAGQGRPGGTVKAHNTHGLAAI